MFMLFIYIKLANREKNIIFRVTQKKYGSGDNNVPVAVFFLPDAGKWRIPGAIFERKKWKRFQ